MADVASLIVRVGAQTRDLEAAFARSTRKVEAFADATSSIGSRLLGVTAVAAGLGGAVIRATATFDALNKGLESVAGSSTEAAKQFQRLREIAKAPGIDLEQAVKGSIQLQAVGASAALAERTLRNVGRAVAASAGGPDQFAGVNRQLQQIAGKGKILAQDLNIIKENAPAMAKALQAAFGATTAEGIEKLNLSTEEFFNRLNDGIEKAIPKVEGGLGNALTNLRSSVSQAFASLGAGQANELTKTIDRLALRIENVALAFSRLSPTTQRYTLYAIGLTAAMGPLLLTLSALANAYRTLVAISLVSSTLASVRAFVAQAAAVRTAGAAMTLFASGTAGAAAALMGPAGIVLALGFVIAKFIEAKVKAAEALQAIRENIVKMNEAAAYTSLSVSVGEVGALNAELQGLQRTVASVGAGKGTRAGALPRERARIREIEAQIAVELEKQKAAAERLNALRQPSTLSDTGNNFAPTGADTAAGDKFKAEKKYVQLLQDAVNLHQLGLAPVRQAIAYQQELASRAALAPFKDQVELLTLAEQLAGAVAARLKAASDAAQPGIDRATQLLGSQGLEDSTGRIQSAAILTAQVRMGAEAQRAMVEYAARYPMIAEEGLTLTSALAEEAENIRRHFKELSDFGGLTRALSGALGKLGTMGARLGEMVSQAGDLAEALEAFKASQQKTGETSAFANIGNLTAALGVAGVAFGMLGGILSATGKSPEYLARLRENSDALERLASQLNKMAGSAREAQSIQIAAGRLAANQGAINARTFGGGQLAFVNSLIADLGITFADLKRIAEDLGIDIVRENGSVAAEALDDLAEALGYHVKIITQLGTDLESFRQTQNAANRIYNVTESPQQALNDALAEIREFAGESIANSFAGLTGDTAAGRAEIQLRLQSLFEALKAGTLSLSDLGDFKDASAFLSSLLGADSALDKFREGAEKASAAMLNVPQGFKTALRVFQATIPSQPTNPVKPPVHQPPTGPAHTTPSEVPPSHTTVQAVFNFNDRSNYASWYDEVQQKATAHPPMRAFAASLAPPSRN